MNINWKLRLKNKATLITLITLTVGFGYQLLALFGVLPSISQDKIMEVLMLGINLLAGLGVLVDPTTKGLSDSKQALTYNEPHVDSDYEKEPVNTVVSDNKTYAKNRSNDDEV